MFLKSLNSINFSCGMWCVYLFIIVNIYYLVMGNCVSHFMR